MRPLERGTSWEEANLLAEETALERRRAILRGRTPREPDAPMDLDELFRAYRDPERNVRAENWSRTHRENVARVARFWTDVLGADCPVTLEALTEARVEGAVHRAGRASGWSPRTRNLYLQIIKWATRFGRRKLRAYLVDPLEALELERDDPDTRHLVYSPEEADRLATPDPRVDWRVTLAVNLILDTGRRGRSVRHLWIGHDPDPWEDPEADTFRATVDGQTRVLLRFRSAWDKGKREALVPLSHRSAALLDDALQEGAVRGTGWLLPGGDLYGFRPEPNPIGKRAHTAKLHEAEEILGVPYVRGRAWHGLKRRHVTDSDEAAAGDLNLVGDLTGNRDKALLAARYRMPQVRRMAEQVDRMRPAAPSTDPEE